ncbi:MAG TPA: HD domain-containing phosphohydrolase [Solirubrobacteraceae bacterium]|jgi:PAS domain S-box-containing protein/putative nucleotidyltransferase with HDIG domain|nr:HD domain-containing phosphohydrolase [Solirubrobacteraceae bacterium]
MLVSEQVAEGEQTTPRRPEMPHPHGWLRVRAPRSRLATILLALALFIGAVAVRALDANVRNPDEVLLVVPIALLAIRFGVRGGLSGGLLAIGLFIVLDLVLASPPLTAQGCLVAGGACVLLGTLLGVFVDERDRLQEQVARYVTASLDVLVTLDASGRFIHVNPAHQRVFGFPADAVISRLSTDFVHRDDREAGAAEISALAGGSHETVGFRNRCRAADGSFRWMEWSATCPPNDGLIYGIGRDITAQHEAEQVLADNAKWLEARVVERTHELENARAETLQRLAYAGEYRDDDTFQHTERVGAVAAEIATRLQLGTDQVELLREAAPLHDIGKLAIPDSILYKPQGLTPQERQIMQTHAEAGTRMLSGSSSPALQMATVIAASHHERWDGTGYPAGLAGEAIPLVGRIVAVADVFDALTHDRPYKQAWSIEQATAEIQRGAGSQFDPRVVAAFLATCGNVAAPVAPPTKSRRPQQAGRRTARAHTGARI